MTTGTLPDLTTLNLRGFNFAGGEFGSQPGTHLVDYFYPDEVRRTRYNSVTDAANAGWTCVRLPFSGRRVLRSRDGELDAAEMSLLDEQVDRITKTLGMYCLLDLHDFGGVGGQRPMRDGGDCVGTAQSGTSDTIVLGTSIHQRSSIPGWMNGLTIDIDGGTGSGQSRTITAYTGGGTDAALPNFECTVDSPWSTIPDATSTYTITSGGCLNADLAYIWNKLATHYKDNLNVIFDIMNEPSQINAPEWWAAQQAAVTEIRTVVGATNAISVEGINFSGAHSWFSGDNDGEALLYSDPDNNSFFQAHQYFDATNAGITATSVDVATVLDRIDVFTQWLKTNGLKGFIGEFGPGKNQNARISTRAFLAHMEANADVYVGWAAWAAGTAWSDSYHFRIDTHRGQMIHEYTPFVGRAA